MNFQNLQKIENPDFYLDVAFRRGKAEAVKTRKKVLEKDHIRRAAIIESERIKSVDKVLQGDLKAILEHFPKLEELSPFYKELAKCSIDYHKVRQSLGAVKWATEQAGKLMKLHYGRIRSSKDIKTLFVHKKSYYGRVSSTLKQIKEELASIEAARKILKKFPAIKTDIQTIVIAGYPNVGKTTLLRALTGSEPKIASYPFTTQNLMLGYAIIEGRKIQIIDTPGLLDRPIEKRNKIELQSILALKHLANMIIFLVDPTESCGYDIDDQVGLLDSVDQLFNLPVTVAINKLDAANPEQVSTAKEKLKNYKIIEISADKNQGTEELMTEMKNV